MTRFLLDTRGVELKLCARITTRFDAVIAIGGGSPLDAGKAARLLDKRPGTSLTRF